MFKFSGLRKKKKNHEKQEMKEKHVSCRNKNNHS